MFEALWTLRLRWKLWLGTTALLLLGTAGPIWWQTPPPVYQAEATLVLEAGRKGILLGQLNSGVVARATGLRAGESVQAQGQPNSELVRVVGTAPAAARAVAITNGVVATLSGELEADQARRLASLERTGTVTRHRLQEEQREVEAALRRLPPGNGVPPVPAGGTLVVVGDPHPKDVFRTALETRYVELTKTLAAWVPPASGVVPAITILDPAVTATAVPPPFAPLRAALIASLILGAMMPLIREWWRLELAHRRGGES